MKLSKLLLGLVILILIGGFSFIALTDISIESRTVTTTIPNERFF